MMTAATLKMDLEGEHLDPQLLGSYHEGHLSSGEESAVQRHLAACRACTDLALELGEFLDADSEPSPEASREALALARLLWHRSVPAVTSVSREPSTWLVAAAVFCALLTGVVGYNLGLSKAALKGGPMTAERLTVIELTDSIQRHDTAGAGEQTAAQPEGRVAILLTPSVLKPSGRYQVRILNDGGENLETVTLPADRTGTLYLSISGKDLSPGLYLFEISTGGGEEVLATLPLEILVAGGGD